MTPEQWCTNQLQRSTWWPWLLVVRAVRELLLFHNRRVQRDPAVQGLWGDRVIDLPFSHHLFLYKAFTPLYDEPLRFWAHRLSRLSSRPLRVINIGANVGDSYALLQEAGPAEVLLIEGDTTFLPFLTAVAQDDSHSVVAPHFVGDGKTTATFTPVSEHGTTRLVTTSPRKSDQKQSLPALDQLLTLPEYQKWKNPDWMVLDTDGSDWSILRGAVRTLRAQPVLFFEYYPLLLNERGEQPELFWEWLATQGYESVWLYRNTGEFLGEFHLKDDARWLAALPTLLPKLHACPYLDVVAV